jgi:hypothetical protein
MGAGDNTVEWYTVVFTKANDVDVPLLVVIKPQWMRGILFWGYEVTFGFFA